MRDQLLERFPFLPSWLLPGYWVFLVLGVSLFFLWTQRGWTRSGEDRREALDLLFWGLIGLFCGAKLFELIEYGGQAFDLLISKKGFSLFGGLFGSLMVWSFINWRRPFRFWKFLDSVAPGAMLGLAVARIGCLLSGCDGGIPSTLPWAVRFPPGTPSYIEQLNEGLIRPGAPLSLPSHPTQLYDLLFALLAFLLLVYLSSLDHFEGQISLTGGLWYSAFRFLTDPLRADLGGLQPLGIMTFSRWVPLGLGLLAIAFLVIRKRRFDTAQIGPDHSDSRVSKTSIKNQ